MTREQINIIEWLKDYNSLKAGIKNLNECIKDIATAGMGVSYDRDVLSKTYKFNSTVENAVIEKDDLEIKKKIKVMEIKIKAIDNALACLNVVEEIVIKNNCIIGEPFYKICGNIHVSERTVKRIKREALRKMEIVIFGNNK